jgi:hypothetical protein
MAICPGLPGASGGRIAGVSPFSSRDVILVSPQHLTRNQVLWKNAEAISGLAVTFYPGFSFHGAFQLE